MIVLSKSTFFKSIGLVILIGLVFVSCKKDNNSPPTPTQFIIVGDGLIVYNSDLITDGFFEQGTAVKSSGVAQWNGSSWSLFDTWSVGGKSDSYCLYNGNLMVAIESVDNPDQIFEWNGTSLQPLNGDFNSPVTSMIEYNGKLIAGGEFTKIGDSLVNGLAIWNGSAWSAIPGFKGECSSFFSFNGKLIVAGIFDSVNGMHAKNIAQWDGMGWSKLGNGLNGKISAMCSYNNNLVVGGYFDSAGIIESNHIAEWNGATWSGLGSGLNCIECSSLVVYNGNLVAGVINEAYQQTDSTCIYQWNGSSWSAPFGQMSAYGKQPILFGANAMCVYNGNLFVTSNCNNFSNSPYNGIAQWNGSSWSPL